MTSLDNIKNAQNRDDLAKLLGFTPSGLSYILYKLKPERKYRKFSIPKKSGGSRIIQAPEPQLALLQRRLSILLYSCVRERKRIDQEFWYSSHGFQKKRTIISNAEAHKRQRFLFNIDLENFFGSINFGRIRGFFIKDNMFEMHPTVATVIAQIACHDNALPQGSPCSPIISNLIGNILDSRLLALARDTRCTYTRYADDLTFSTNELHFPTELAINTHGPDWEVGNKLNKTILDSGFRINLGKTRMSLRRSRQTVTGLTVNQKVNIKKERYREVRSMCHSLFTTGKYLRPGEDAYTDNLNFLTGILSHIYFVKMRRDRPARINNLATQAGEFTPPQSLQRLYHKFLFYKYFVSPSAPLIVTEGISDITYLQCALRELHPQFPLLAKKEDKKIIRLINFLTPSGTSRDVLNLAHGAGGQANLIAEYTSSLKIFNHKPMHHPVIILCDNDEGPKKVFKNANSKCSTTISTSSTNPFYYLGENLYLIKTPENAPATLREIEDLFDPKLFSEKLEGKSFNRKKDHGDHTHYGKVAFARDVIRANSDTVDFSGFHELLNRIEEAIKHFATLSAKSPTVSGSPVTAAP